MAGEITLANAREWVHGRFDPKRPKVAPLRSPLRPGGVVQERRPQSPREGR